MEARSQKIENKGENSIADQLAAVRERARRQYLESRGPLPVETEPDQLAAIREEARRRFLEERRAAEAIRTIEEEPIVPPPAEFATPGPSTSSEVRSALAVQTDRRRAPPGCLNCRVRGHSWKSCGHPLRLEFCRRCNRDGVTTANCPGPHGMDRARAEGRADRVQQLMTRNQPRTTPIDMACPRCFEDGHGPKDCPVPWTPGKTPYCIGCYRVGYTRATCPSCNPRRRY